MAAKALKNYQVVGRYMNGNEVTGYRLVDISNGGRRGVKVNREQMAYLLGKSAVQNCCGLLYPDKLVVRGVGTALESLPVKKDPTAPKSNISTPKLNSKREVFKEFAYLVSELIDKTDNDKSDAPAFIIDNLSFQDLSCDCDDDGYWYEACFAIRQYTNGRIQLSVRLDSGYTEPIIEALVFFSAKEDVISNPLNGWPLTSEGMWSAWTWILKVMHMLHKKGYVKKVSYEERFKIPYDN